VKEKQKKKKKMISINLTSSYVQQKRAEKPNWVKEDRESGGSACLPWTVDSGKCLPVHLSVVSGSELRVHGHRGYH
jgi:hypothetical protein